MKARQWVLEYGVAMMLSFGFAAILGHVPLFRETPVGKLHASDVVQFLGYSGAMVIAWFGARQLSVDLPEDWKWLVPYRALILPATALALVAFSYGIVLLLCGPYLSKFAKGIYNWVFIVGIVANVAWLIKAWVQKCAPLVAAMTPRRLNKAA